MSLIEQNRERGTDPALARLTRLIPDHTPHDGVFETRIPGLYVSRFTQPSASQVKTFYMSSLAMTVQGEKVSTMGRESYLPGASQIFAFPAAMPIGVNATRASREEPLLGLLRLELDPHKIERRLSQGQGIPGRGSSFFWFGRKRAQNRQLHHGIS